MYAIVYEINNMKNTDGKACCMFLGVQIVSVCVMFCVFINFLLGRKLPILSTRWYMVFLCTAIANFLFEIFSLLTIYEILPAEWNTISHMLFYFSEPYNDRLSSVHIRTVFLSFIIYIIDYTVTHCSSNFILIIFIF